MSSHELTLKGLDPQDPLGYLAALGTLTAATDQAQIKGWAAPTMRFSLGASPRPTLSSGCANTEALVSLLLEDLELISGRVKGTLRDRFLAFSYEDEKGRSVHDLKPPPAELRRAAEAVIAVSSNESRRTADWFSAVLTDAAVDNNGSGKPFALHFTAGQQRFLNVALELLDGAKREAGVGADDLAQALLGPWPNDRALKVFSWSPTQDRSYALRAVDPSDDGKLGSPGADWLALRGIALLSSAPIVDRADQTRIATGGVTGGWKNGAFTYPVWPMHLASDAVQSLLRHPALASQSPGTRRTLPRGVERWTCKITRSEQGGYGAFLRPIRTPTTS